MVHSYSELERKDKKKRERIEIIKRVIKMLFGNCLKRTLNRHWLIASLIATKFKGYLELWKIKHFNNVF